MTTVSPSSMLRRVTMPSMGDVMVTWVRSYSAPSSDARSWRMRCAAPSTSTSRALELGLAQLHVGLCLLVDLAGDEAQRPEILLALEVLASDLQVDAGRLDRDLRLLVGRGGGLQGCLPPVDDGLQVLRVDLQEKLPGRDALAFVHRQARDPAPIVLALMSTESCGWMVPGRRDYRDEIAPPLDRLDVDLRGVGAFEQKVDGHERGAGQDYESTDEELSGHVQKPRFVRATAMISTMAA